jgi:hypothetical protein
MFSLLPEELFWDFLFPMFDTDSLSHFLLLSKDMLKFTRKKNPWWNQRIKKEKLYTSHRPYPEYKKYSGIVFLRLAKQKTCFSCLQPTKKIHAIYHIPVCKECSQNKIPYQMITKSTAMKEYCLRGKEVDAIQSLQVANPRFRTASPMRLYMLVDVLARMGDRDVVLLKEKKQQSLQKRRQKKEQLETERRQTLEKALQQVGVEWRNDSELCEMYVSSQKTCWELEQIVEEMALMKYLHNYTDYRNRLEKEVENLCQGEGYYYQGIWKEASETVKRQYYPLPTTWPWLVENMEKK